MKKILSIILALAMVLSISTSSLISVNANEISPDVTNLVAESYSATKVLRVSGDSKFSRVAVMISLGGQILRLNNTSVTDGSFTIELPQTDLADGDYDLTVQRMTGNPEPEAIVTVSVYLGISDAEKAAAQALETERMKAKAEINRAYATYDSANYSDGKWADLTGIKDAAVKDGGTIDLAADGDAIAAAKQAAIDAMTAVVKYETELQQAKTDAKAAVGEAYAAYQEGRYLPEEWTALTALYEQATKENGNIDTANTLDAVAAAKAAAIDGMASIPESGLDAVNFKAEFDIHTLELVVDGESALGAVLIGLTQEGTEELTYLSEPVTVVEGRFCLRIKQTASIPSGTYTVWAMRAQGSALAAKTTVYIGLTEADDLILAKEAANEELAAIYHGYDAAEYAEADYLNIGQIYQQAAAAVDAAQTIDAIALIIEQAKADMAAVATLKQTALAALRSVYDTFDVADYTQENYQIITSLYNQAISDIEAGAPAEVGAIVDAATTAMDAVLTIVEEAELALANAKAAARQALTQAFEGYEPSAYTSENYAQIEAIFNTGIAAIEEQTLISDVETIRDTTLAGMEEVLTIEESEAIALAEAKQAAKEQLEEAFTGYIQADYSAESYLELQSVYNKAVEGIGSATSVDAVNQVKQNAMESMDAILTVAEEAAKALAEEKQAAITELDEMYAGYVSKRDAYTADNFAKIEGIYHTAKQAVVGATAIGDIAPVVATAKTNMAAIKTIAEDDAAALAQAKADAGARLKGAFDSCLPTEYSTENYAKIQKAYQDALTAIEQAQTIGAVDQAVSDAIKAMDTVPTADEEAAQQLEQARNDAGQQLKGLFEQYSGTDYMEQDYQDLQSIYQTAVEAVKTAAIGELSGIVVKAQNEMATVPTKAQREATALAQAKEDAKQELDGILKSYSESDYYESDFATIKAIYNEAVAGLFSADSQAAVAAILVEGKADMAAVPTKAARDEETLVQAKESAKMQLKEAYDRYDKDTYSTENYGKITAVYNRAIADVNAAGAAAQLASIVSKAAADMAAIPNKAQQEAAALAAAKESAKKELKSTFESYDESEYSEEGYVLLESIYQNALSDVDMADTVSNVTETVNQAKTAMDEVLSLSEETDARFAQFIEYLTNLTEQAYVRDEILANVGYYEGLDAADKEKVEAALVEKLYAAKKAVDGSLYTYTQAGVIGTPLGTVAVLELDPHLAKQGELVIGLATYQTQDGSMVLVPLQINDLKLMVGQAQGGLTLASIYIYDTEAGEYLGAFDGNGLNFGGDNA